MTAASAGDHVEVTTDKDTFEGVLLQSPKKGTVVLKLDSGYNVGIDERNVKAMHVVERVKEKKEAKKEGKKEKRGKKEPGVKRKLPLATILHTGGTIASKVDYKTGGVIPKFTPRDMLDMFPEMEDIATISSRFVRQMWSEDMRFAHYNLIAREVAAEIKKGADAVIVTHGTDTLHYTAAALAFMFEQVPVPVILVGSQRSSDRGSSDAAWNLLSAVVFATHSDFGGIAICMHENMSDENCVILPATKSRKMHSSRRDAFKAINTTPWARVNPKTKVVEFLRSGYKKKGGERAVVPRLFKEKLKVGIMKVHTNMYAEQYSFYDGWDGLVIEGLGIGGHPQINETDEYTKEHTKIATAIKKLTSKGVVVVAALQTIFGRVNLNVYSTGRKMQELGIIGNYSDMTPETTFVKLAWLLSNYPKEKVKELMVTNLRGEITERTEIEEEFLE